MQLAIIDYSIGNIQSIINALSNHDLKIIVTSNEKDIIESDAVILPGVGAFKKAMDELEKRRLPSILDSYIKTKKPILGICLGMQLLLENSTEFGKTKGLGFCNGEVIKFPKSTKAKLPHVSWNSLDKGNQDWDSGLLETIKTDDDFYFVHSYICNPPEENILAYSNYGGIKFCAALRKNNIYGCQFHPEKSSLLGLKILSNFIKIAEK